MPRFVSIADTTTVLFSVLYCSSLRALDGAVTRHDSCSQCVYDFCLIVLQVPNYKISTMVQHSHMYKGQEEKRVLSRYTVRCMYALSLGRCIRTLRERCRVKTEEGGFHTFVHLCHEYLTTKMCPHCLQECSPGGSRFFECPHCHFSGVRDFKSLGLILLFNLGQLIHALLLSCLCQYRRVIAFPD